MSNLVCPTGCPPVAPIVCEPIVVVRDHFVPQIVPVIHPIQVIDKVHCVPVEQHVVTYSENGAAPVTVSGRSVCKRRKRRRSRRR